MLSRKPLARELSRSLILIGSVEIAASCFGNPLPLPLSSRRPSTFPPPCLRQHPFSSTLFRPAAAAPEAATMTPVPASLAPSSSFLLPHLARRSSPPFRDSSRSFPLSTVIPSGQHLILPSLVLFFVPLRLALRRFCSRVFSLVLAATLNPSPVSRAPSARLVALAITLLLGQSGLSRDSAPARETLLAPEPLGISDVPPVVVRGGGGFDFLPIASANLACSILIIH